MPEKIQRVGRDGIGIAVRSAQGVRRHPDIAEESGGNSRIGQDSTFGGRSIHGRIRARIDRGGGERRRDSRPEGRGREHDRRPVGRRGGGRPGAQEGGERSRNFERGSVREGRYDGDEEEDGMRRGHDGEAGVVQRELVSEAPPSRFGVGGRFGSREIFLFLPPPLVQNFRGASIHVAVPLLRHVVQERQIRRVRDDESSSDSSQYFLQAVDGL
mmetsp:Transcript_29070/g.86038  ORF Transcript_29070/g.86038 Transcript_29070/m.86038 type:complete len:214 (+) Transcript_29070:725-1366(+)